MKPRRGRIETTFSGVLALTHISGKRAARMFLETPRNSRMDKFATSPKKIY